MISLPFAINAKMVVATKRKYHFVSRSSFSVSASNLAVSALILSISASVLSVSARILRISDKCIVFFSGGKESTARLKESNQADFYVVVVCADQSEKDEMMTALLHLPKYESMVSADAVLSALKG